MRPSGGRSRRHPPLGRADHASDAVGAQPDGVEPASAVTRATAASSAAARTSTILLESVVSDDERRAEEDQVAVDTVRVAGGRVDQQPAIAGLADERLGQAGVARERDPGLAIGDQLEPDQQPAAADLADVRVIAQAGGASSARRRSPLAALASTSDSRSRIAEDRARDRGTHRVVRVREAVDEPALATVSWTSPEAATNPNGQPDVAPLAATRRSARTPQWSSPNQRPVRPNPVMTSSAMSSTPWRRQTSTMRGQ